MAVLIVANQNDPSLEPVIDWIEFYGKEWYVTNLDDFKNTTNVALNISNEVDDLTVTSVSLQPSIKKAWFRSDSSNCKDDKVLDHQYGVNLKSSLFWEYEALKRSLFEANADIEWLSTYETTQLNKISVLRFAREVGLSVPDTLVTNNRDTLHLFLSKNRNVICKAAFENLPFIRIANSYFKQFVEVLTEEDIAQIPQNFFPSFFQKAITKAYDVRVFYLNGKCYSMAIFSQRVDFRADYTSHRNVPLKIPDQVEAKVDTLMKLLGLNTGSIDFVKSSEDGFFYFLEVNPNGQFSMVSSPCNYYIERDIAKFLCDA